MIPLPQWVRIIFVLLPSAPPNGAVGSMWWGSNRSVCICTASRKEMLCVCMLSSCAQDWTFRFPKWSRVTSLMDWHWLWQVLKLTLKKSKKLITRATVMFVLCIFTPLWPLNGVLPGNFQTAYIETRSRLGCEWERKLNKFPYCQRYLIVVHTDTMREEINDGIVRKNGKISWSLQSNEN